MEKFTQLTAIAAPMPLKNVDTDYIIRVERCAQTPWDQLGQYAFEMARFLPDGKENPEFVLNQPKYRGAKILVCGEFFGTGSSREMAVWAIAGMGIRCLIAPSFGQIFFSNCFQNGVLPIKVSPEDLAIRLRIVNRGPDPAPLTVLPTLWFRNTWSWDADGPRRPSLHLLPGGRADRKSTRLNSSHT